MEAAMVVLVILGVVGLIGGLIWLNRYLEKRRTEKMKAAAASMGLAFEFEQAPEMITQLAHFPLFQNGHTKRLRNVIGGSEGGVEFKLFDYRYTTGSGKNSHTWHQTVIVLRSQKLRVPSFTLRPENIFHKIGSAFGYQDIDFESHPKFSKKYLLRGEIEGEIRNLFAPHVLDYFDQNLNMNVEALQGELIFYRAMRQLKPEELRPLIDDGLRIHNLFGR
jgi:hypothetical protein